MILSLDQATNVTGYCIFSLDKQLINYGIINLSAMPKGGDVEQTEKRYQLVTQTRELVFKYKITQVITEGVYGGKENLGTYKKLAQTQSSLQDWCRNNGITCFSWANAGEWRSYLNIKTYENGKRVKSDQLKIKTKEYVLNNYSIPENLEFDIYDAIGSCDAYFKLIENKG